MKIYLCGDSTMADYPPADAPMTGWGQALKALVKAPVVNLAACGRSTKSFLSEGRLQAVEGKIEKGDLLLIQFSHNDESPLVWRHTDPWTGFKNNLCIFIDTARLLGAAPVLLTPICRRTWENGALSPSHGEYPQVIRALAAQRAVPLIDLYEDSFRLVRDMGEEESRKLYMHIAPGAFPRYPDGLRDDTHFQRRGAESWARIAAQGLRALGLIGEED